MLKNTKRIGFVLGVLVLTAGLLVLAGCKKGFSLKGMEIVIGTWWADYDTTTYEPRNEAEEKQLEWRIKIQEDNGFTMREANIASWGEMAQVASTSILAGSPAATVFVLQPDWAMALMTQNLAYPISDNKAVDIRNPQPAYKGSMPPAWNQNTIDAFTFGGKTYAVSFATGMPGANVVFFNKRLFREAGLDPDTPYNMQRDGTWTWDAFLDICKQLTRDTNNDGIMDTYALPRDFSSAILDAVLFSNGAQYVEKDAVTDKFANATNRPEFLEGLQYAIRLNTEGVMKPKPDGANWDWFKSEFADGNVAMRIDGSYVWGELRNMRDDWGVVLFPRGPRANNYYIFTQENVLAVPAAFSQEQVDKIMYALALWFTPVTDDWRSSWYNTFRDARAVDETLTLIRDVNQHKPIYHVFIPGLSSGAIAWEMWYHDGDPAQLIEAVSQNWNSLIEEVNASLF